MLICLQDSIHRSHDVSAESPFSNYDTSPLLPSGAPSARNYKKRTLSAESDDLRESSTAKARRQGSSSELPVNSLYLSASSDSINGELDSMQYSMQPTRPLKPKDPKSSNSLSFKVYED